MGTFVPIAGIGLCLCDTEGSIDRLRFLSFSNVFSISDSDGFVGTWQFLEER